MKKLPRLSLFGGTGRGLRYLGNITHQVNTSNVVVAEYNFDAWGRRRSADDWSYTLDGNDLPLFADRGFTGHETLPLFNLVNMNGRLYDPVVGRFLSPDPVIQNPDFTQNYNRYSYVLNNPLRYNDPSGYYIQDFGRSGVAYDWSPFSSGRNGGGTSGGYGGTKLGGPGQGINGIGLNGVYYDWHSKTYRSTDDGMDVGYGYVQGTISQFGATWSRVRQDAYAGSGNVMVYKGSIYTDWKYSYPTGQGGNLATVSFIAGAASLGYDSWQNLVYNGDRYTPTKGPNAGQKTSVWKMNKSGNYAKRNGERMPNSANAASKIRVTNAAKAGGVALNVVGLGFTIYDMSQNGVNTSNGVDFVMGCVAFVPCWGWAVSGAYFLGKAGYEYYFTEP